MPAHRPASRPAAKETPKTETVYGDREEGAISGCLGRDFELKFTKTGRQLASSSVAVQERYQDEQGKWVSGETEWFDVTLWGQLAENAAQSLGKGDLVVGTGYYQDVTFTTKEGEQVTKTQFTGQQFGPDLSWVTATVKRTERN